MYIDQLFESRGTDMLTAMNGQLPDHAHILALTHDSDGNIYAEVEQNIHSGMGKSMVLANGPNSNWYPINNGLNALSIKTLIDFHGILYTAINGIGVLKSQDYGHHWIIVPLPQNRKDVENIFRNGNSIFVKILKSGIVYQLANGYLPWKMIHIQFRGTPKLLSVGNTYYISASYPMFPNQGVLKSNDDGKSWQPFNTGLPSSKAHGRQYPTFLTKKMFSKYGYIYLVLGDGSIYRISPNATVWEQVSPKLPENNVFVRSVMCFSDSIYMLTAHNSIYIYSLIRKTLRKMVINTRLKCSYLDLITHVGNSIYIGSSHRCGIYKYEDRKQAWESLIDGLDGNVTDISTIKGTLNGLYAGTYSHGLYQIKRNEKYWSCLHSEVIDNALRNTRLLAYSLTHIGNHIFAATNSGLYELSGFSDSWYKNRSLPYDSRINGLYASNGKLYISLYAYGIYESEDLGISWHRLGRYSAGGSTVNFALYNNNLYISDKNYRGGVLVFRNNIWHKVNKGLNSLFVEKLVSDGNNLYVATRSFGNQSDIYVSKNGGKQWEPLNKGLGVNRKITSMLKVAPNTIIAGSDINRYGSPALYIYSAGAQAH